MLPFRRQRSWKRRSPTRRAAPRRGPRASRRRCRISICPARSLPARPYASGSCSSSQPGDGLLHRPAHHRPGEALGAQGAGDPCGQPRQPRGHAGDPLGAPPQAAQAHGGGRGRGLLLPQPARRLVGVADLQHRADRAKGRGWTRRAGAISTRCSTRAGTCCFTRRAPARAAEFRGGCGGRGGAGIGAQPGDRPDPRHGHRRGHAAGPAVAQRLHGKLVSRRHRVTVSFGEPIPPMAIPRR